jgi:hypothetical protein
MMHQNHETHPPRRLRRLIFAFALFTTASACLDDDEDDDDGGDDIGEACVPGQTIACACAGGASGVQSCNDIGSGFDACSCGNDSSGTTSGDGDGDDDSGCNEACQSNADCTGGLTCLEISPGNNRCGPSACGTCFAAGQGCLLTDLVSCGFQSCDVPTCDWTYDNVCDEPEGTGACPEGSDEYDCSPSPTCGGFCTYDGDCGLFEGCLYTTNGYVCLPYECQNCFDNGLTCYSNTSTCEYGYCG